MKPAMLHRELKKGSAELMILSVLETQARHGYEIGRLIEQFAAAAPITTAEVRPGIAELTEREREILLAVASGMSNAEIAETMFISHATAKTHVSRLLTKLVARDRAQLVMIAYESGVVTPGAG